MVQVRYTRNLFLRGICIIYLFAFLSFYIQIPGLYGDNGILPAKIRVDLQGKVSLAQKFKHMPTMIWLAPYLGLSVEYMLDIVALLGCVLSFMGFISQRFCIAPIYLGLWALYYSLYQIGQVFMQSGDNLLLESGFLCIAIAPFWYPAKGKTSTPSDTVTFWSVRWLLFRLLFSSGAVKFISGCPSWWNLESLTVHFESQCIPTPLAWYAHHLPSWFLRLTTVGVNVSELVVPFLFFFPNRRVKIVAFYIQIFLQINIIATGNWNIFNFLTICLCIALLDDQFFYKKRSKNDGFSIWNYLSIMLCLHVYGLIIYGTYVLFNLKISNNWTIQSEINFDQKQFDRVLTRVIPVAIYIGLTSLGYVVADSITHSILSSKGLKSKLVNTVTTIFYTIIVCFIFAISVVPFSSLDSHASQNATVPVQLKYLHAKINYLRIVNEYGVFRQMTGVGGRPEITIEGSNDVHGPWKEYEFLYKPGNVNNSLPFVAPHQPRLDWQMWFAARDTYHQNPWIISLAYRLLSAQPEVLALMNGIENPFRNGPPKYIKASLYHYHYVPWSKTWSDRTWWTRKKVGEYFPVFSQDHPPLLAYLAKMKITPAGSISIVKNEPLKMALDVLRSLVAKVEASLLMWSVFTAGCAIIMTSHNNISVAKKK